MCIYVRGHTGQRHVQKIHGCSRQPPFYVASRVQRGAYMALTACLQGAYTWSHAAPLFPQRNAWVLTWCRSIRGTSAAPRVPMTTLQRCAWCVYAVRRACGFSSSLRLATTYTSKPPPPPLTPASALVSRHCRHYFQLCPWTPPRDHGRGLL